MTIGNVIIFFAALLAILAKDSLSAGEAGLSITSSLQIVGALVWVVRYGNFWLRMLLLGRQIMDLLGHVLLRILLTLSNYWVTTKKWPP